MKLSNNLKENHILILSAGALCISFAPIFVKLVGDNILGPTAIAFWRLLFGAIILSVWILFSGGSFKMSRSFVKYPLLAGALFFLDLFLWHRSIIITGAGMATILGNTQVFGTAILSFIIFKEKLSLRFFGAAGAAIFGVVLLVGLGSDINFSSRYIEGILFGLGTGVVYSNYIVTLKMAGSKKECPKILSLMFWVTLISAVITGISSLLESSPTIPPNIETVIILVSLALVAQALGWWFIASSLPKVEGSRSGLILLLQPVLATLWGFLIFQEQLSKIQLLGAVITLVAIYAGSIKKAAKTAA